MKSLKMGVLVLLLTIAFSSVNKLSAQVTAQFYTSNPAHAGWKMNTPNNGTVTINYGMPGPVCTFTNSAIYSLYVWQPVAPYLYFYFSFHAPSFGSAGFVDVH